MSKPINKFKCRGCGILTNKIGEHYYIDSRLWLQANRQHNGMMCIGCVEARIGRSLTPKDFIPCPLHNPKKYFLSTRLKNRLGIKEKK